MQTLIKTFFEEEIAPLIVTTRKVWGLTKEHRAWLDQRDREVNPKFYKKTKEGQAKLNKQIRVTEF